MSSNGIFNTNISWTAGLLASLPIVGPVISEYQMLHPKSGESLPHAYAIRGQLFDGGANQPIDYLHRHVTVCSATASISSLTTAIAGVAATNLGLLSPYYALPAALLFAANSCKWGSRAWECYNDAFLFHYA